MIFSYDLLIGYSISFVRIAALALGGYFLIGTVVSKIREKFIYGRHDELSLELISHVVSYILFFGVSVAIFHELGINITAFLGLAGILGIAIGYAAQSNMANIISGLMLMIERPFKIGDLLVINGIQGHVADVNLFAIVLKTTSNGMVRIPHEQYHKSSIANLSALPVKRYDFCIEVQNVSSIASLYTKIEQIIESNKYRSYEKKVYLEIVKIYGYTITLAIGIWVTSENSVLLQSQIVADITEMLEREGMVLSAFYRGHDKGIT